MHLQSIIQLLNMTNNKNNMELNGKVIPSQMDFMKLLGEIKSFLEMETSEKTLLGPIVICYTSLSQRQLNRISAYALISILTLSSQLFYLCLLSKSWPSLLLKTIQERRFTNLTSYTIIDGIKHLYQWQESMG